MKISIYTPPIQPQIQNDTSYIMVHMTAEEAARTIISLAAQLKDHSPNSGREEFKVHGQPADGYFNGYFSISVQPELICIHCGEEIKPYSGKLEKEGYICSSHLSHKEQGELEHREEVK